MSKNELMSVNLPDRDPSTIEHIMTRNDMRKTLVTISFIPRKPKLPELRRRRWEFATTVLAREFIETVKPPLGQQLGSPKQARAKLCRLLGLTDMTILDNYDIVPELEVHGPSTAGNDDPTQVEPDESTPDKDNEPEDDFDLDLTILQESEDD